MPAAEIHPDRQIFVPSHCAEARGDSVAGRNLLGHGEADSGETPAEVRDGIAERVRIAVLAHVAADVACISPRRSGSRFSRKAALATH